MEGIDPKVWTALPLKVRKTIERIIRCHNERFTGSLELHYKDGTPVHAVRRETERF